MLDDKIKRIIEFIARESECESGFLYPDPQWYVFSVSLLDEIKAVYEAEEGEVGEVFNAIREEVEAKAKEDWGDEGDIQVNATVKPLPETKRTKELKKLFKKP